MLVTCVGELREALERVWESPGMALGAPWEAFGIAPGGPEQVPGLPMIFLGCAGQPMGHLDLRFPTFLSQLPIWTYVI